MKNLLIAILLTISSISYGQISMDTTSYIIYDSISKTSTDWSPFLGAFDSIQPATLTFDTITINDFANYKKKYHSKIDTDSSKLTWTDTSFTIKTTNWEKNFNTRVTDDFAYNYYLGFLKPLHLFIVSNIDGRNELGTLVLIDEKTGKAFYFSSGYDYPCEALFISPKNKYLLAYANNWAEHNQSVITILKVVKTKNHYTLKAFTTFNADTWTVNEIAWIDDHSFAVSVKEKIDLTNYDKENGINHYLKASFTRKN